MKHYCIQRVLNLSLCLVFLFSLVGVPPVQAGSLPIQPQSLPGPAPVSAVSDAAPTPPPPPAGSRLGYNSVTGRLNFVGGDAAAPLARAGEMSAMGVRSAADGVLAQYAPQFGVQNPAKDLRLARTTQDNHGSAMRYQQTYQGIPILGGELIVNSDTQGHVLSLNGEVSPDLALSTPSPAISAQLALQSALDGAKGWYGLDAAQIVASQPALWIYDPRILQEDNDNPVSLVWRLELRANASSGPVDELVLVDATSGVIDLHFSQVEHSDATYDDPSGSTPTPEAVPTETPAASPTSEPPATETPRETATSQPTATPLVDNTSTQPAAVPTETPLAATEAPHLGEQVQSGITWYVAPPPAGSDTNDCAAPATPCTTINSAFGKASAGDTVEAAAGTYTGSGSVMVLINKSVNLSGGWNADFSSQDGYSVLDGQNQRCGILVGTGDHSSSQPAVTSELDRLILTRGASNGQTICWSTAGIIGDPNSYLTIKNSSIQNSISPKNDLGLRSYVGNSLSVINSTITSHVFGVSISDTFQIDLRNVSIVNNPSGGLGIGATAARAANVHVHIVNSMIANNNGPNPDCDFLNIKNVSGGYNLIQDIGGNCGYTPQTGDIIATDPKIGALMPEGYYKLLPGSAAIDSGDPDVPGSGGNTCEVTDQLGNIRPIDGDNDGTPRCDIGAFETTPPTPPAVNQGGIIGNSVLNAILNTAYAPFSVKVTDQYGLPVSDAQVTLNAPSSGASGQFAGSTSSQVVLFTGNDGVANAPIFTANGLAGIYNVQATTPGVDEPAIFEMENYLPAPGSIVVSAGDKQKVSPGNVFPADLKAIVQDQHGRTMPGVTVTFTAPLSGASATFNTTGNSVATAISDNNGFASVTATANDTSGLYTVSASVAGISQTADFTLINIIL
jgi:hypothetical protein